MPWSSWWVGCIRLVMGGPVGGRTDLDNLLPLCTRHHTQVHQEILVGMMTPDRAVTIEFRKATRSHAPPGAAPWDASVSVFAE